jgi:hypothetical protein
MELDEFKTSWGAARKEGPEQAGPAREAVDRLIARNGSSLGELREKSAFWNKFAGWNAALLVLLPVGSLVWQYHRGLGGGALAGKLSLVAVLVGFALFSRWAYRQQEEIFSANRDASSREALRRILAAFNTYYRFTNAVFLLVSPVAFYAVFEVPGSNRSVATMCLAAAALTGFSFLLRYGYYRAVFFRRIQAMEANLRELEEPPGF